jgi:tRNA pseudouridine38-40 synthase
VRVRLDLGYDGAEFSGWAKQVGLRTVESTLEEAVTRVFRLQAVPRLTVAGRTDAGVHARGQVAHIDLPSGAWTEHHERALHRLRGVLPDDIRVTDLQVAPPSFDARFGALSRRYSYALSDDPTGVEPTRRRIVAWHRRPLDVTRLNEAAAAVVGEHDFVAFCRRREGASTVRELQVFEWLRDPDGLLIATVVADAFCHNMVRSLVGACVAVGEGAREPSWVAELLMVNSRSSAVMVMPAHGLTLEEVRYPPDAELASRARSARRFRGKGPAT